MAVTNILNRLRPFPPLQNFPMPAFSRIRYKNGLFPGYFSHYIPILRSKNRFGTILIPNSQTANTLPKSADR